jgi:virginiamycin B lyase
MQSGDRLIPKDAVTNRLRSVDMAGIRSRYPYTHSTIAGVAIRALLAAALSLVMLAGFAVLPAHAATSAVTEWAIPTADSQAQGIAVDEQFQELWFAEGAGKIGRVDLDGNCTDTNDFDYPGYALTGKPANITVGPGGTHWFTEPDVSKLGCYVQGGANALAEYAVPTADSTPWGITTGTDGQIWFTERSGNKIGSISAGGAGPFFEFDVPTADSQPWGIAQDQFGNVWFTENAGNKIGVYATHFGVQHITEFAIPTKDSGPTGITVGSDGNIWFTESNANRIGRLMPSGRIDEFGIPAQASGPCEITTGQDGNVWFTERDADKIGVCTPSGRVTEFELAAGSRPHGISTGPDAAVWFVEQGTNRIGRMPAPFSTWYLAEGSTAWGFSTYISVENPDEKPASVKVTYETGNGRVPGPALTLPGRSQATINPRDTLGAADFSTRVSCEDPTRTIAVDRTMSWTGPGAGSEEGHSSVGVTAPSTTWYFAEGSSAWGFECWLLVQNPKDSPAACTVDYYVEGQGMLSAKKTVPANSRKSFNIADDIGAADASINVTSSNPVIAERSMYRNNRREGHASVGMTRPADHCYLAEGTTASGFTSYVLVENPNDFPTAVSIGYMTPSGKNNQPSFRLDAHCRKTIRVNDVLPGTDFSTVVTAGMYGFRFPVVAERAMYWDNGTGEACHDSIGMAKLRTTFYLPDGQTSGGRETWTLVQNPNDVAVKVEIIYMTSNGAGDVEFTDTVPARSRRSYNMADGIPDGRAAIMVTSKTKGRKIACERAMYWNNRGAGTNTIGAYSD